MYTMMEAIQATTATARGSGTAAGENILLGGKTGIAQVDVHVHQSGGGAQAALTVDDLRVAHLNPLPDSADHALLQKDIGDGSVPLGGGIIDLDVLQ